MSQTDFQRISLDVTPEFAKRMKNFRSRHGFVSVREMIQQALELMWTLKEEAGAKGTVFVQKVNDPVPTQVLVPYGKAARRKAS